MTSPAVPLPSAGAVRVTAALTRPQATAALRSVPWVRRAVARWMVATLLASGVGAPFVTAFTGSVALGAVVVLLLAVALADAFLRGPWTRPARRPLAHGVDTPVTWTFSAAGVDIDAAVGRGFRPWAQVAGVRPHGDLLVLSTPREGWLSAVPLLWLPPGAVEQVTAWHAAAAAGDAGLRADVAQAGPAVWREGADVVVVAPVTTALVRAPLVAWTRTLHRDPVRLLLLALPAVALAVAASSGDAVRRVAAALAVVGVLGLVVGLELLVRADARGRGRRFHAWRLGEHAVSVAVDGTWQHVPWSRVARLTVTPRVLLAACKDLDGTVVVPIDGAPDGVVRDVVAWCRAAGVPVRGGAPQ